MLKSDVVRWKLLKFCVVDRVKIVVVVVLGLSVVYWRLIVYLVLLFFGGVGVGVLFLVESVGFGLLVIVVKLLVRLEMMGLCMVEWMVRLMLLVLVILIVLVVFMRGSSWLLC